MSRTKCERGHLGARSAVPRCPRLRGTLGLDRYTAKDLTREYPEGQPGHYDYRRVGAVVDAETATILIMRAIKH